MADAAVTSHIIRSNLPSGEKNAILRFLGSAGSRVQSYGHRAGGFALGVARASHRSAPVATAVGMATGGVLGALHVKLPQGLDIKGKAPADLIASITATAIAMGAGRFGGFTVAHHAKTVAISAGAIFTFRKTVDLVSELERRKGRAPGGTVGMKRTALPGPATHHGDEDPLAAFARTL
jgi:hypothetical protein